MFLQKIVHVFQLTFSLVKNWNDFRSRWNKIEFCHTVAATIPPFNVSSLELTSTSFELDESLLDLKKVKFVVGIVSSVDLGIEKILTNLTVILEPVEEPNNKKVCAFIYHSPLFTLPNSSKFCSLPSWPPATDMMTYVERGKQKSHNDCLSGGALINLNLKEKADEDGAQFLTEVLDKLHSVILVTFFSQKYLLNINCTFY